MQHFSQLLLVTVGALLVFAVSGFAAEGVEKSPSNATEGSCLLQTQQRRFKQQTYVWQRALRIHQGKSTEEILQDLPYSLLHTEVEELASHLCRHLPNHNSAVKTKAADVFNQVAQKKHLGSEYTFSELKVYKDHVAKAFAEDVRIRKKHHHGHKPGKSECTNMMVQELVQQQPVVTQKSVKRCNDGQAKSSVASGYKCAKNKFNSDLTLEDYSSLTGTVEVQDLTLKEGFFKDSVNNVVLLDSEVPATFDPAQKWPQCQKTFKHVRDQGKCGSCWAQATIGAFEDRLCVASGQKFTMDLSVADMTACSKKNLGCQGGNPYYATQWLTANGVVSGGDYPTRGTHKSCYPYPIADRGSKEHFHAQVATPDCLTSCAERGYKNPFSKEKFFSAGDAYLIGPRFPHENANKEQLWAQVKQELSTKGSIMMMYAATKEHMAYSGGIWDCPPGTPNHGVKCIAYGVDAKHGNFITCVNSWNVGFGEQGLFHMQFPGNGCLDMMMGMPVEWKGKNEGTYMALGPGGKPARKEMTEADKKKSEKAMKHFVANMRRVRTKHTGYRPFKFTPHKPKRYRPFR